MQAKWILLQPSRRVIERIEGDRTIIAKALHLHIICMSVAESNWASYIHYLQMEAGREVQASLQIVIIVKAHVNQDERACFSKVNNLQRQDFDLNFTNIQKLQLVRRRLFRSLSALESAIEITRGCIEFCKDYDSISTGPEDGLLPAQMQNISSKLKGHRRRVLTLLKYFDRSTNLV